MSFWLADTTARQGRLIVLQRYTPRHDPRDMWCSAATMRASRAIPTSSISSINDGKSQKRLNNPGLRGVSARKRSYDADGQAIAQQVRLSEGSDESVEEA
jgi:hypothetical protein